LVIMSSIIKINKLVLARVKIKEMSSL